MGRKGVRASGESGRSVRLIDSVYGHDEVGVWVLGRTDNGCGQEISERNDSGPNDFQLDQSLEEISKGSPIYNITVYVKDLNMHAPAGVGRRQPPKLFRNKALLP